MKLAVQVGNDERNFKDYFKDISSHEIKYIELGSKFIMNENKLSRIQSWLDLYNLSISSVYEFGHFQSLKKREIILHHQLLANKMKKLGIKTIILSPGMKFKSIDTRDMYFFIKEIIMHYRNYDIKVAIHPHFKQCIFDKFEIISLLNNIETSPLLLLDTIHFAHAKIDIVDFLHDYKNQILGIHFRDFLVKDSKIEACSLGNGVLDIPEILNVLNKSKIKWLIIEGKEKDSQPHQTLKENLSYFNKNKFWSEKCGERKKSN